MIRKLALAGAILLACSPSIASADTFTDAGGTVSGGWVDVSRSAHAAAQCVLTVTATATPMTTLWATAGCPAFPANPQFAFVMPTGGNIYYRTDGVTPTTANAWPIFQNQAWPVEGRLSVVGLQLIASAATSTAVEVRW